MEVKFIFNRYNARSRDKGSAMPLTAEYRMISDSHCLLGVNQASAGSRFCSGTPIGIPLGSSTPQRGRLTCLLLRVEFHRLTVNVDK